MFFFNVMFSSMFVLYVVVLTLHNAFLRRHLWTLSRGTSGFDNSGRGYYFANRQQNRVPLDHRPYPPPPQDNYDNAHRYNNFIPENYPSQVTSPRKPVPPEYYQGKPAQSPVIQTISSGTVDVGSMNSSTTSGVVQVKDKENTVDNKETQR